MYLFFIQSERKSEYIYNQIKEHYLKPKICLKQLDVEIFEIMKPTDDLHNRLNPIPIGENKGMMALNFKLT